MKSRKGSTESINLMVVIIAGILGIFIIYVIFKFVNITELLNMIKGLVSKETSPGKTTGRAIQWVVG